MATNHTDVRSGASQQLRDQAADFLRVHGVEATTLRALAEETGCAPATLQYQFGSKGKLLSQAYEVLQERAAGRLEEIASFVDFAPLTAKSLSSVMLRVLGFGEVERSEQVALLELLSASLRNRDLSSAGHRWLAELGAFWMRVARALPLSEPMATFLLELQLGLMLHVCGLQSPIEASMLASEVVERALLPQAHWSEPQCFRKALSEVLAATPPAWIVEYRPNPTAAAIAKAAYAIAVEDGASAVTYRSVAARARVSVSAITHYFPTRDSLLYATYRALHDRIISYTRDEGVSDEPVYLPEVAERIVTFAEGGAVPLFLALSEFELLAAKFREFAGLARYFRMTRGLYHTRRAEPSFDPLGQEAFDAFASSIWLVGHSLRCSLSEPHALKQEARAIAFGFQKFGFRV